MAIKQVITAECDAYECRMDGNNPREVQVDDHVTQWDDMIFHDRCFQSMSAIELIKVTRQADQFKVGTFRPSEGYGSFIDENGLPNYSHLVAVAG